MLESTAGNASGEESDGLGPHGGSGTRVRREYHHPFHQAGGVLFYIDILRWCTVPSLHSSPGCHGHGRPLSGSTIVVRDEYGMNDARIRGCCTIV